tara:strand:- start:522 stop:1592 length:1071 start_codon:yes stop_codon:yes gene_type:complete
LENLPQDQASSRFTASTVEMVAIRAKGASSQRGTRWAGHIPGWLWILIAALLSGTSGYAVTRAITMVTPVSRFLEDRNAFLLEHSSFLEHLPEYQLTDNIDFLTRLRQIDYFADRIQVSADPGILKHGRDSDEDTRRHILGMNSGEKNRLHQNYVDFLQIPQNEQARLLEFHDALLKSNDADTLSKILIIYARWYQQLDPLAQVEITLRPQNKKMAYIQKVISSDEQAGRVVTGKDLIIMHRWLEDVALRNEKRILRVMEKDKREAIAKLNESDKSRQLVISLRKYIKRDPVLLMHPIERKQYQLMTSKLSDACQKNISRLPTIDDKIQLILDSTRRVHREQQWRNSRSRREPSGT